MANRLKTVQYAFPTLASLTNNLQTSLTQITIYLPEATKTFRKVWLDVSMDDTITGTGGSITTKTIELRLGAAAYTSTTNSNTITHSAENISYFDTRDFTTHFTANWSGTSMTCDARLTINQSTGLTPGMSNVSAVLNITYEYDDTAATQVKTVLIPLNAPVTALPTIKTSHDTIPELRSYLPEANKTFRDIFIILQANRNHANNSDYAITLELSSLGTTVASTYEAALLTDAWTRYVYRVTGVITTTTTHTFNVWSSLAARFHTMQAWMVVTYEFDASVTSTTLNGAINNSTTSVVVTDAALIGGAGTYYVLQVDDEQILVTARATNTLTVTRGFNGTTATSHSDGATVLPCVMNSIQLPLEYDSPMGGTSSDDFQRASRDFFVQESNPVFLRLAALVWWMATANEAGLNARIGTGSFVAYTNTGSSAIAGSKGLMLRNDAPSGISLGRGRNILTLDLYRTSTTQIGGSVSILWLINYVSPLASAGHGAHNHTVNWLLHTHGTGAAVQSVITTADAPDIPETGYYIVALGLVLEYFLATILSNFSPGAPSITIERLVAEGGLQWERGYADGGISDSEVGQFYAIGQVKSLFTRWPDDADSTRIPVETARRYRVTVPGANATTAFINKLALSLTYHSITYTVSGTISGSSGGTVTINLHRLSTGEKILSTSRVGNGAYSFTWYDNTEEVYVVATESASLRGVSKDSLAPASDMDINLSSGGSTVLPFNAGFYG